MKKFFNWVKRVFTGWYNRFTGKNMELGKQRLEICMKCEDKLRLLGDEYICSHCGCPLKSKTLVNEEKCSLNKW